MAAQGAPPNAAPPLPPSLADAPAAGGKGGKAAWRDAASSPTSGGKKDKGQGGGQHSPLAKQQPKEASSPGKRGEGAAEAAARAEPQPQPQPQLVSTRISAQPPAASKQPAKQLAKGVGSNAKGKAPASDASAVEPTASSANGKGRPPPVKTPGAELASSSERRSSTSSDGGRPRSASSSSATTAAAASCRTSGSSAAEGGSGSGGSGSGGSGSGSSADGLQSGNSSSSRKAPLPAYDIDDDDGEWEQLPADAIYESFSGPPDMGWETAPERGRRGGKKGSGSTSSPADGDAASSSAVHLKHVTSDAPLYKGGGGFSLSSHSLSRESLRESEEGHTSSDLTMMLTEEDWSSASAGSAEDGAPMGRPRDGSGAASPPLSTSVAGGAAAKQAAAKRAAMGGKGGSLTKAGMQLTQRKGGGFEKQPGSRGGLKEFAGKELHDEGSRVARAAAAIDLDVIVGALVAVGRKAKSAAGAVHDGFVARTPRTQQFFATYGAETYTQLLLVLLAVMLLHLMQGERVQAALPPALLEMSLMHLIEVPIGFAFALKFAPVDIGGKLRSWCSPRTVRNA